MKIKKKQFFIIFIIIKFLMLKYDFSLLNSFEYENHKLKIKKFAMKIKMIQFNNSNYIEVL